MRIRFRFILLALLMLAGTPAHAEDCWKTFRLRDFIGRALGPYGAKSDIGTRCFPSADAAAAQVRAEATPWIEGRTVYTTYTMDTTIAYGGCGPGGWEPHPLGRPTYACQYQVTEVSTLNQPTPPPPTSAKTDGEFVIALECGEAIGKTWLGGSIGCVSIATKTPQQASCPVVGNPVRPLDGLKSQTEPVLSWGRGHALRATYAPLRQQVGAPVDPRGAESFGPVWFSNLHKAIVSEYPAYQFQRGEGVLKRFTNYGATASTPLEIDRSPVDLGTTAKPGRYFDASAGAEEEYAAFDNIGNARISRISYVDGRTLNYEYVASPAKPGWGGARAVIGAITDESGRRVSFEYEVSPERWTSVRLKRAIDPAGQPYVFGYGAGGVLTSITGPDGAVKGFAYGIAGKPLALTGTIDENGVDYGTYTYDADGRATGTRNGANGQSWQVAWASPPQWGFSEGYDASTGLWTRSVTSPQALTSQVTGPDGRQLTMTSEVVGGSVLMKSSSQPAGAGCAAATSLVDHDGEGNDIRRVDFNNVQSCHAYVSGRHLESARVEGLTAGATCAPLLAAGAALPAGSRKISTQWHPDWRMSTRTAEPRRITTLVFNGQPDPLNGNVVASCAPAEAKLSSGKPIVVLCKRVEQATTDETGALGFTATLQSGVAARATSWTYNATGQVLTETDPRGKVVATNEYYADTTADHTKGDLKSSINAAGHVTQFPRYDAYGKPLEMIDANGISTTYAYDLRQRLLSVTTQGEITSYTYWPTGLMKTSTQPDGSLVSYEYDDAHRLVAASDSLGNRVEYTLDQSGNRKEEKAKDPTGTLKRSMNRVFDALGRAQQTTGRE